MQYTSQKEEKMILADKIVEERKYTVREDN